MNAERLLLKTNAQGWITGLPQFEPNQEVELIVLFSKKQAIKQPNKTTVAAINAGERGEYEAVTLDDLQKQWEEA